MRSARHVPAPTSPALASPSRSPAFWYLALGAVAATAADLILSQRCERRVPGCVEANPLFPKSRAGADVLELSVTGLVIGDAYGIWPRHPRLGKTMLSFALVPHLAGGLLALRAAAERRRFAGAAWRVTLSW